ncbi:MAG: hypothetical protein LZF60_140015 [Nitrospira sp.]|nr:MAG: hypothetical protein LZF60_140015 [Nitrospira sp.]
MTESRPRSAIWHRPQGSATLASLSRVSTLTRSVEHAKETGSFDRPRPEPHCPSGLRGRF